MVLVIDNYDSLAFNRVQFLGELEASLAMRRNNGVSVAGITAMAPGRFVLSPGPCPPKEAGICGGLVRSAAGTVPIFRCCLGHQSIGEAFGGDVHPGAPPDARRDKSRASRRRTVLEGLEQGFVATRYHSLMLEREPLPNELEVSAWTEDGIIMGPVTGSSGSRGCSSIPSPP